MPGDSMILSSPTFALRLLRAPRCAEFHYAKDAFVEPFAYPGGLFGSARI